MSNFVPDYLPMLRKGVGETPKNGGCLVQIASYLKDGSSWTDSTPCVNPVLRRVAIKVNDEVSDSFRPQLAPLAADLVNTNVDVNYVNVRLALFSAKYVFHIVPEKYKYSCNKAIKAAEKWLECPCVMHATAAAAYSDNAAAYAAATANSAAYSDNAANSAYSAAYAATAASTANNATDYAVYAATAAAATATAAVYNVNFDEELKKFFVELIAEYRRVTDTVADTVNEARWNEVCSLIGTTAK